MSAKDRLVMFMLAKSMIIDHKLQKSVEYFTPEDAAVIRSWDDDDVRRMLVEIHITPSKCDDEICPFCMKYGCMLCPYGIRHGICASDTDNTYDDITMDACESIVEIVLPYSYLLNQILHSFYSYEAMDALIRISNRLLQDDDEC